MNARTLVAAAALVLATLAASPRPATLPRVAIETPAGTIVVELRPDRAPLTVKNFLAYVDGHAYDRGATFYRAFGAAPGMSEPKSGVIQGGFFQDTSRRRAPIPLEKTTTTGLHNENGAISMARTADPSSGTSEFFICVGDDTFLDTQKSPDGQGYAAFGRVVRGYDVVLRIQRAPETGEYLNPPVTITRIRRM